MGWRGTIALAVALALVVTYAYVDLRSPDGQISIDTLLGNVRPTPPGSGKRALLSFRPEDVVAITIQQGDATVAMRRDAASWTGIGRPELADDFLTNLLDLAEILVVDVPAGGLADHGLDPPRSTVTLQRRTAPPLVLQIGAHNPPATGVYVRIDGESRVILTGALILWEVDKVVKAAG